MVPEVALAVRIQFDAVLIRLVCQVICAVCPVHGQVLLPVVVSQFGQPEEHSTELVVATDIIYHHPLVPKKYSPEDCLNYLRGKCVWQIRRRLLVTGLAECSQDTLATVETLAENDSGRIKRQ